MLSITALSSNLPPLYLILTYKKCNPNFKTDYSYKALITFFKLDVALSMCY